MSPTATTPTMSIGGINLDGYDGYMPAWSPTLSNIADFNQALPIVDNQVQGARGEALELSVKQLRRWVLNSRLFGHT
jgi:hypothetical protein